MPDVPAGPPGPGKDIISLILRLLREHIPGFNPLAITQVVLDQALAVIKENIHFIIGTLVPTVGVTVLIPSLTVVLVNLLGFTANGVLAGSIAAFVQSLFWGGSTGGIFSALQAFGATATISLPALAIGGGLLLGWWWWNRKGGDDEGQAPVPVR
ncbi:hypothetical protein D9613_002466 [Agrocybe pediades]|uniref:Uncharacterized protein n=1 Tax=Agrocybe pediades TaxID=84607 RepID=A0A8H4VNX5_9AGAR|nr:hypothetical protein D9613_002466 [Agrocybe pediades]